MLSAKSRAQGTLRQRVEKEPNGTDRTVPREHMGLPRCSYAQPVVVKCSTRKNNEQKEITKDVVRFDGELRKTGLVDGA